MNPIVTRAVRIALGRQAKIPLRLTHDFKMAGGRIYRQQWYQRGGKKIPAGLRRIA